MKNKRLANFLRLSYLGKRKRKPIAWGRSGHLLEDCINQAKEFISLNGGKFVGGFSTWCELYDIESEGQIITMQSIPIFSEGEKVDEDLLKFINQ